MLVLGGDPVVGRVLASLLDCPRRAVRYVELGYLERPGALDGVGLLILAPSWSSGDRDALLDTLRKTRDTADVPLLEIGQPEDAAAAGSNNHVPWPCRTEELQKRIDAALRSGSGTG